MSTQDIESRARKLYSASTANDPTMHCNRFPAWSELDKATQNQWRQRAAEAIADEPAGKAFIERMRKGHAKVLR